MAKNKTLEAARKAYNKSNATKYRVQAGGKKTKKKEQKVKSHYGGVAKKTQDTEENRTEARTKTGSVAKTVGANVVKGKTTDTKPTTTGANKQNGSRSGAISPVSTKQKERQTGASTARTTAKGVGKTVKTATNLHKAKTEVTDVTQGTARGTAAGTAFNKSKAAEKALEKAGEKKTITVKKDQLTAEQKAAQEQAARATRFYTNSLVASGRMTQKQADDAVEKARKNAKKGVKEDHTLTYSNATQSNEKVQRVANASKFTNVEVEDKKAKEKAIREARFYTNSQVAAGNMSQKEADKIVKEAGKGHRTTQSANILDKLGGEGEAERQGTRQAGQMNDSKFASGVMQGMSYGDNTRAVGKYNKQAAELVDTVKQSGAFNAGYMTGQGLQFMLGGTNKMTDALVKGVAKSGAARSALNIGLRKGGADMLFESPINTLDALKMSTDSNGNFDKKAFAKYMALNAGLSGGMGGAIGGIGAKMTKEQARSYLELSAKAQRGLATEDDLVKLGRIQKKFEDIRQGNDVAKTDIIDRADYDAKVHKEVLTKSGNANDAVAAMNGASTHSEKMNYAATIKENADAQFEVLKAEREILVSDLKNASPEDQVKIRKQLAENQQELNRIGGIANVAERELEVSEKRNRKAVQNLAESAGKMKEATGVNYRVMNDKDMRKAISDDMARRADELEAHLDDFTGDARAQAEARIEELRRGTSDDLFYKGYYYKNAKGETEIIINSESPQAHQTVMGHETGHLIKSMSEDEFFKLGGQLEKYARKMGDWDAVYEQLRRAYPDASRKDLREEVTCELLGRYVYGKNDAFIKQLAGEQPSVLQRIVEYVKNLLSKTTDSEMAKELQAIIDKTDSLVRGVGEANSNKTNVPLKDRTVVEAGENIAAKELDESGITVESDGKPVAQYDEDGSFKFSVSSYEDSGRAELNKYLDNLVKKKEMTKVEADQMRSELEKIYKVCREYADSGKYAPFSQWSDAKVVIGEDGKPVFSSVKKNSEYEMNIDFSTICKKRRTLDAVFNELVARGVVDAMNMSTLDSAKFVVKMNDIIRKHGFEAACEVCFVEARRYRQQATAQAFADLYNDLVKSMYKDESKIAHFNYGGDRTISDVADGIHTMDDSSIDLSHIEKVMEDERKKAADKLEKEIPSKTGKARADAEKKLEGLRNGTIDAGTVEAKAARLLYDNPSQRKLLQVGDMMGSKGFENLKVQNPELEKIYNAKKGTGGAKSSFGDVQYLNEIINSTKFKRDAAYAVGGVRVQSFSDYVPRMVFDYVQMVGDLAAKRLPMHSYTKEPLFAKQFGLSGIKINLSLVPKYADDGVAAGLDKNGKYLWNENGTFPYDEAVKIQNAEGYKDNCGTIAVGVSDEHIRKMLDDPNIQMIIPYHKSSLNPVIADMTKVKKFTNYEKFQTTKNRAGKSISESKDFPFNEELYKLSHGEDGKLLPRDKWGDPRELSNRYLKWCDDNGYTPKFPQFRDNKNYYKLLEDFGLYDSAGNFKPQHDVQMRFPEDGDAFGSMKDLIKSGLEEDAILEGKRTRDIPSITDEVIGVAKENGWLSDEPKFSVASKGAFAFDETMPSADAIESGDATYMGFKIQYKPTDHAEARNLGDSIVVSDKFLALDEGGRKEVLAHEVAHNVAEDIEKQYGFSELLDMEIFGKKKIAPEGSPRAGDPYYEGLFGDVGANSLDESITDAVKYYITHPDFLKERSQEAFDFIDKHYRQHGFSTKLSDFSQDVGKFSKESKRPLKEANAKAESSKAKLDDLNAARTAEEKNAGELSRKQRNTAMFSNAKDKAERLKEIKAQKAESDARLAEIDKQIKAVNKEIAEAQKVIDENADRLASGRKVKTAERVENWRNEIDGFEKEIADKQAQIKELDKANLNKMTPLQADGHLDKRNALVHEIEDLQSKIESRNDKIQKSTLIKAQRDAVNAPEAKPQTKEAKPEVKPQTETQKVRDNKYASDKVKTALDDIEKAGVYTKEAEKASKRFNNLDEKIGAQKSHIENAKKSTKYATEEERNARVAELEDELRTLQNQQAKAAGKIEQMGKMKAVDDSLDPQEQFHQLRGDTAKANTELKNADNLKNEDNWIKDKWNSVRRLWEDSLIEVENVAKRSDDKKLREEILTAANRVRNSQNVANFWITQGRSSFDNKVSGKALDEIFTKELLEDEAKYKDFQEYLIMKHVPARHAKGTDIYPEVSPELANKIVKKLEGKYGKELTDWADDVYGYLKDLQQYRVDSGMLSKEAADQFSKDYPFYVPTNRVNEDEAIDFFTGGLSNQIRTAKGGENDVLDMYSQLYTATNKTIHAAEENEMLNLYFRAKGVTPEQIKGAELPDLEHAVIEAKVNKKNGNASVSFFVDGKPVEFPCSHQLALGLRELDGLEFERLLNAAKMSTLYGKPFKALITDWNLVFGVRNGMRDMQQAVVNSKDTRYFGSSFGAAGHAIAHEDSPYRKLYASMGGERAQLVSYDAVAKNLGIEKQGKVDALHEKVQDWVDADIKGKHINPVHYIEGINGAIEMMPRMCEFIGTLRKQADKMLKQQGSSLKKIRKEIIAEVEADKSIGQSMKSAEVENRLAQKVIDMVDKDTIDSAMRNANDITLNFGRSGVLGKALNMGFVPYLNPSIQGLSKLVRLFTEAGGEGGWKSVASIGMKLGTFTIAPAVWNELALRNNEEYQNLNTRDKDNNFFIALGDGKFIKIPKPRENAVLAEPVEYGLRYFLDKSEYAFFDWDKLKTEDVPLWEKIPLTDEGKQSLRTALDNIGVINPMTSNMVSPLWQTFHNKTWYGGSIESAYETAINEDTGKANVPVNKRYDTGTSGVAIWLGQTKVAKELNLSPKKIDNILDSYTGMIYDLGISQTTEEAKTRGNYLLRTAASQFMKDSVFSNKLSTKAWEKIDGMSKKEQDEYKSKYMYDAYKYDDAMDAITADKNMTVKEKMEAKRFLQKQRNKLYRAAINGEENTTNPLKDISKYLGANKTLNKFLPKSGDEQYDNWTDYYKNYKKTKGYKGLTPAQKEKEAQKFLDVYTLGVKGQSKISSDFHDSPSWGMTGVAAAQRYKQGKLSQKDAETIMQSCGVYESQTASYFKYTDHGGDVSRYAVTKKNNNKAEDLAESLGVTTSGDGSIWKNKYSKEKGIKGGVLSMSLATGKADFKDRAYYISNSGDSNMLIKMNAARGYAEKYGHTTKQLIKLGKKADADGNTYLSNEEIESACNTIKGGKATSEEKAMGWVLLGGNPNKNPFGAIGDYSHDGDTGITMDDDGKSGGHGRRGRGRRGRRGGGGGGSSKGTMPKTESGAIKGKVTDVFANSNGSKASTLNDAYRKKVRKLRKELR